jgi:hypothetical protein
LVKVRVISVCAVQLLQTKDFTIASFALYFHKRGNKPRARIQALSSHVAKFLKHLCTTHRRALVEEFKSFSPYITIIELLRNSHSLFLASFSSPLLALYDDLSCEVEKEVKIDIFVSSPRTTTTPGLIRTLKGVRRGQGR